MLTIADTLVALGTLPHQSRMMRGMILESMNRKQDAHAQYLQVIQMCDSTLNINPADVKIVITRLSAIGMLYPKKHLSAAYKKALVDNPNSAPLKSFGELIKEFDRKELIKEFSK